MKRYGERIYSSNLPQGVNYKDHDSLFGGKVRIWTAGAESGNPEPPVFYGNGLGSRVTPAMLREINEQTGRRAFGISFRGARGLSNGFTIVPATREGESQLIVPENDLQKAVSFLATSQEKYGNEQIDAIFQSESAGFGILAMYFQPQRFRRVVLAYPGALTGPQPKGREILRRIIQDHRARRAHTPEAHDRIDTRRGAAQRAIGSLLMGHTASAGRLMADARALQLSALAPLLPEIKEQPDAPDITLVIGEKDTIFPRSEYPNHALQAVDRAITAPGPHAIRGRLPILQMMLGHLSSDPVTA